MRLGKKAKCIELLALGVLKQTEIAKELGVADSTICRWKKDPEFMEHVISRARCVLKESLPEVYKALRAGSKSGNDRHIKLLLDHLEKLEETKAGISTVSFTWKGPTITEHDEAE